MEKRDVKLHVKNLFDAVQIERVVYVDDLFSASVRKIIEICDDLELEDLRKAKALRKAIGSAEEEDIVRSKIEASIAELNPSELRRAFAELSALVGVDGVGVDSKAADEISDVFPEDVEFITLSLSQWKNQANRYMGAGSKSSLFLFDDDFRHEGFSDSEGRRLIKEIGAKIGSTSFVALLTHKVSSETSERLLMDKIVGESPELANQVIVISKSSLVDNRERFPMKLKLSILCKNFDHIKKRIALSLEEAQAKALGAVDDLAIEAFERIIFHSSKNEGVWAPDTLLRIYETLHEKEARRNLRGDEQIHAGVKEVEAVGQIKMGEISDETKVKAEELQRIGIYDGDGIINQTCRPTTLGDIFEDCDGQIFVLLAQPCDLTVRRTGYRRDKQRDAMQMGTLARIKSYSSKKLKKLGNPASIFKLPYFDSLENIKCVELNYSCHVPLWILDLAALNTDGACRISSAYEMPPVVISTWVKRANVLRERAEAVMCGVENSGDGLIHSLTRLPLESPFEIKIERGGGEADDDWRFEAGLRRIERIREPYASAILSQFGAYFSRVAYPHDLTRMGEK